MGAIFCALCLHANVADEASLLNSQVIEKINSIGSELKQKTGIELNLLTIKNPSNLSLKDLVSSRLSSMNSPYILLVLSPKNSDDGSGKVDIFASSEDLIDKDEILSPLPETGTIIPILVSKKGKDIYNAALLNGYGDIADKIAEKKGIKLESSIGSSNKTTLNFMRYLIYGSIIIVIFVMFFRKKKR